MHIVNDHYASVFTSMFTILLPVFNFDGDEQTNLNLQVCSLLAPINAGFKKGCFESKLLGHRFDLTRPNPESPIYKRRSIHLDF